MNAKKEYGDFQTPLELAAKVSGLVSKLHGIPEVVIEPTCGIGTFLHAAMRQWGKAPRYFGFEINQEYIQRAKETLGASATLRHGDFFSEDWDAHFGNARTKRVFVLGNPPWVTNSALSRMDSRNLPPKTNFQNLRGLDARTGKANFDIAEWIIIKLLESLPPNGVLAMLCKTATARKVLRHLWKTRGGLEGSRLFRIDAKDAFDVAVDACLFLTTVRSSEERTAAIHGTLDINSPSQTFGFVDGDLVADINAYRRCRHLDGGSMNYTWRSGLKHDAASVMEFDLQGNARYRNGFGEETLLEEKYIYPLLKSSDIGNGRIEARKFVLVPQTRTGDDTAKIRMDAPLTWNYLTKHKEIFNKRQSSIYRNRPPFSVFGIGPYSFSPWKVAISGLYKTFTFVVIPPVNGRPVMLDDTCYAISCQNEKEARLLWELLSSPPALEFLRALVFTDSKRPVTVDILRRLSIIALARHLGKMEKLGALLKYNPVKDNDQTYLLMEDSS